MSNQPGTSPLEPIRKLMRRAYTKRRPVPHQPKYSCSCCRLQAKAWSSCKRQLVKQNAEREIKRLRVASGSEGGDEAVIPLQPDVLATANVTAIAT